MYIDNLIKMPLEMRNSINRHLKVLNDLYLDFYGFSGSFSFCLCGNFR